MGAAYRVFAVAFATCLLYDAANRGTGSSPGTLLVTAGAALVLLRPRWTVALVAVAVAFVADLAIRRPAFVFVHWYFDALIGTTIVLGWLSCAIGRRTVRVAPEELLAAIRPAVRALGAIALGFAGLAKLNTMFLDPAASCGAALYLLQAQAPGFRGLLPEAAWARAGAIALTVAAELGGAVAVLVPVLRPVGLVLAAFLLFLLGINPVGGLYEFAGPTLATLILFAEDDLVERAAERLRTAPGWVGPALAVALLALVGLGGPWGCRVSWWLAVPALVGLYGVHRRGVVAEPLRSLFRGGAVATWIVPLAMFANEVLVYVGLPHNATFTMASDLRMTPGRSNHVLVSPLVSPGGRPVRVVSSDDAFFRAVKRDSAAHVG